MSLRIYNTLSRASEPFSPLEAGHVRMYVCGMTIYDLCHIGHARMMMAFDVVQRWLKSSGYRVTYVRNITDIDDKIIKRAVERGITIRALTDEMIAAMHQDIGKLGIEPPTLEPRATEYVPQMLSLISQLESKGLAYKSSSGDVNYAVRKFPGYGKLSGKSLDELRAGERVAVLDGKDDPLDFVLWKAAKESEPDDAKWDSAALGHDFGKGRPGWHIECSAMSCRTALNYSDVHLDDARTALKRLYTALELVPAPKLEVIDWSQPFAARFKAAMDEDFGTPEAVAVLFDLATEVNKTKSEELAGLLKALGACLGLLQGDPKGFLQNGATLDEAAIGALIAQRAAAKATRDFALADSIRKDLLAQGIVLKDSATGTTWEVVS
jgi:cysteinyl-tRNA synthetase